LKISIKGTIAIFIRTDVVCVALFMKLIRKGFKRDAAAEYIDFLIEKPGHLNIINFIMLKSVVRNSGLEVVPFFAYGPVLLNLDIDKDRNVTTNLTGRIEADEWDDIQIINVVNIQEEVDAALAQLS
jgi:flagellar assembly factor FliW